MDAACWERVQSIFHEAIGLGASERSAFLEKSCGDDAQALAEVRQMVEVNDRADSILDRGLPGVAYQFISAPMAALATREVGAYRLVRLIGEGGMGVVYLAERTDTGKQVAMKFLPGASMSPARRALFAHEMKTHARLAHPCIAAQYDAGALANGTPWFVMEYVEGKHFLDYCEAHQCSMAQRLRLFREVCSALEYLHGRGIIHRDLKPSNIMVDENGTPRVLDFGIARELTLPEDQDDLNFMTRAYAAPEWIESGVVDHATDVYALGIIFGQMLEGLPGINKTDRRELGKIHGKAVKADPAERYQSVEALRRDIDHLLKKEPLEGVISTRWYRVERFITRNRQAVIGVSAGLLLFGGMAAFFTVRLTEQRDIAVAEVRRTKLVEQILFNLFQRPTADMSVLTLISRGEREARTLDHEPQLQAELNAVLGRIYQELGKFDHANDLLSASLSQQQATNANSSDVADGLLALGLLRLDQAKLAEASTMINQALAMRMAQSRVDGQTVARAKSALGRLLFLQGRYTDAIKTLEEARKIQIAPDGDLSELAATQVALHDSYFNLSRYPEAQYWGEQALVLHEKLHGHDHPLVAIDLRNLANVQTQTTHYAQAERYLRDALAIEEKWYGDQHPDTAAIQIDLAQDLQWERHLDEAEQLLKKALLEMENAYGRVHPRVAFVLNALGNLAFRQKRWNDAEQYNLAAIEIYQETLGEKNQNTVIAQNNLASVYLELHQYPKAEKVFRRTLDTLVSQNLGNTLNAGVTQIKLGHTLVHEGRYKEAESILRQGCATVTVNSGPSAQWVTAVQPDFITISKALAKPDPN